LKNRDLFVGHPYVVFIKTSETLNIINVSVWM